MTENKVKEGLTVSLESAQSFGPFEVNFRTWRLERAGVPVKLQRKPFQILQILIERRGQLVSRKQLAELLWPELHVDYERSLNTAMNSLRQALGDSAKSCEYIETCPGLGYRFIAQIGAAGHPSPVHTSGPAPAIPSGANADYRKGLFFCHKMTPESLGRARAYLESALRADWRFAPAHAALADVGCLLASWGAISSVDAGAQARAHAQKALELDGELAHAHAAMATASWMLGARDDEVEPLYRRGIATDPECVFPRVWCASWLAAAARHSEAAEHIAVACELEPTSLLVNYHAAWLMYVRRDYRSALEHSWDTLMLEPAFAPAQYTLALAYEQLGMAEEAVTEFENARRCSSNHPRILAGLAHILAKSGMHGGEAADLREELAYLVERGACSPYWKAIADVGADHREAALDALEKASATGDWLTTWIAVEPRFDALRQSERFQKCLPFS